MPKPASIAFMLSGQRPPLMRAHEAMRFAAGPSRAGARVLAERATENLAPVEILQPKLNTDGTVAKDAEGKDVLEEVSKLRLTRWRNAFSVPNSNFNDQFHLSDPDRFYIRIKGYDPAGGFQVGTEALGPLNSTEATSDALVTESSEREGSGQTWKTSPQLLVADAYDDHDFNGEADFDNAAEDTTHLATPSARVKVKIPGTVAGQYAGEISIPVQPFERKVTVNIRVLSPAGSLAPGELTGILKDVAVAREIYSQIGVQITASFIGGAPYPDSFPNGNVTLGDQQTLGLWINQNLHPPASEIQVVYVRGKLVRQVDQQGVPTTFKAGYTASVGLPPCVISLPDRTPTTLAHEIGHALGCKHVQEGVKITHRLMTAGGTGETFSSYLDSKRFGKDDANQDEEPTIKSSTYCVKLP